MPGPVDNLLQLALNRLAFSHDSRTGGLEFDKRVFHFSYHEFDQFIRIFGLIEHGVDVGADNVAEACKDAHGVPPEWFYKPLIADCMPKKRYGRDVDFPTGISFISLLTKIASR
jgi:hypothetical protein